MSSDLGLKSLAPGSPFSLAAFEQQLVDVRFTTEILRAVPPKPARPRINQR
jgi:hypothetical protein